MHNLRERKIGPLNNITNVGIKVHGAVRAVSEFCGKQWSAVHLLSLCWHSHILIFTHAS